MSPPPRKPSAEAADGGLLREAMLPVAVLVLVAVLDVVTGSGTFFYPFLTLAPALGATVARPAVVLAAGACAIPLRYLLAAYDETGLAPYWDTAFLYNTFGLVAATLASAWVAHLRVRRERKLTAVSAVALAAQRAILIPPPERIAGVRVAVRYYPIADHAELGGDLYDVQNTPHGVRVVIGDVAGKGLGAVRTAAAVLGSFREAAHEEPRLGDVVARVERSLYRDVYAAPFVTALFLQFDPTGLEIVHRGHEMPLMAAQGGPVRELAPPEAGLPLGLGSLATGSARPAPWHLPFGPGDLLILVTDGVADARDVHGRPYPLPDRAAQLLAPGSAARTTPATAVGALGDDVLCHTARAPLSDDTLIVALDRSPPTSPQAAPH